MIPKPRQMKMWAVWAPRIGYMNVKPTKKTAEECLWDGDMVVRVTVTPVTKKAKRK